MDCKDGKCFVSLPNPSKQIEKPLSTRRKEDFLNTNIIVYTIQQDEDFVPLEIDHTDMEQDKEFYLSLAVNNDKLSNHTETLIETDSEVNTLEVETEEEENSAMVDNPLIVMGEIEYVCEEDRSVICDVDTKICECA